jgi:hypothetical protein
MVISDFGIMGIKDNSSLKGSELQDSLCAFNGFHFLKKTMEE